MKPNSCQFLFVRSVSACLVFALLGISSSRADQKQRRADGTAPQSKPQSELLTKTLGMKLALIPAGEFQMGTSMPELSAIDPALDPLARTYMYATMMAGTEERPQHRVRITKAFYLGRTEVTIGQFRRFVAETSYESEAERDGNGGIGYNAVTKQMDLNKFDPAYNWQRTGWEQTDNHPVVNVSWNDAMAFCEWLSKKEGRPYRLPTEAEWEYGCRAGTTTMYYHGNGTQSVITIGNVADKTLQAELPKFASGFICKGRDGFPFTAPVGRFEENGFRLFDMTGNVWEWCSDRFGALYYDQSPMSDPSGPTVGGARVIRGGGWLSEPATCRSAVRSLSRPNGRSADLGFRVALTAR